jgi:hypothetical protein
MSVAGVSARPTMNLGIWDEAGLSVIKRGGVDCATAVFSYFWGLYDVGVPASCINAGKPSIKRGHRVVGDECAVIVRPPDSLIAVVRVGRARSV